MTAVTLSEHWDAKIAEIDDVEQLRQMLYQKEEKIQDSKPCIALHGAEMPELRRRISTTGTISVENMKNEIASNLKKKRIALMTKKKK